MHYIKIAVIGCHTLYHISNLDKSALPDNLQIVDDPFVDGNVVVGRVPALNVIDGRESINELRNNIARDVGARTDLDLLFFTDDNDHCVEYTLRLIAVATLQDHSKWLIDQLALSTNSIDASYPYERIRIVDFMDHTLGRELESISIKDERDLPCHLQFDRGKVYRCYYLGEVASKFGIPISAFKI